MADDYKIYNVVHPEEVVSSLYPILSKDLLPVFDEADGPNIRAHRVKGIFLLGVRDGRIYVRDGSKNLEGTLWITRQRVILVCKNYDKVTWDRGNTVDAAIFGVGVETAFHLGSKAYHKVTSIGKAMVAHLYFPWIKSVSFKLEEGRKSRNKLRFEIQRATTKDKIPMYMEVTLDDGTDTGELARSMLQCIAAWHLESPLNLTAVQRDRLTKFRNVGPLQRPDPGMLKMHALPIFMPLRPNTTPEAIAGQKATEAAQKRGIEEQRTEFRRRASECRPPAEWVETPTGDIPYESPLGVLVAAGKLLRPRPEQEVLFHGWVYARGFSRLDPETKLPNLEGGVLRPLYQGQSQILVTNHAVFVGVTIGKTGAGDVGRDNAGFFLIATPLEEIASIGMAPVTNVPNHTGPDLTIVPKNDNWGTTWINSIGGEYVNVDGEWLSRSGGDLSQVTEKLAHRISAALDLGEPPRQEIDGGFMYNIAKTDAVTVGAQTEAVVNVAKPGTLVVRFDDE